jgi:hypothetical protein
MQNRPKTEKFVDLAQPLSRKYAKHRAFFTSAIDTAPENLYNNRYYLDQRSITVMRKKNMGRRIQILANLLAVLCVLSFLGLGVFFLISTIGATDATLRTAGIEGLIVCVVLAILSPFLSWILYGFGTLIITAEERLATERETKELLRAALSDGALSDDIARKVGIAISKAVPPSSPAGGRPAQPVARPAQPVAKPAPQPVASPVQPMAAPAPTPVTPVAPAPVPVTPASDPVAPAPAPTPVAPPPVVQKPAAPAAAQSAVRPLTPLGGNNRTY